MSETLDPRLLAQRAELPKLRASLVDPITGLPALPAVVEAVRRRIEAGENLGLIYLDLRSEEKIEEIARMLGGVKITAQTLAHAREMLEN